MKFGIVLFFVFAGAVAFHKTKIEPRLALELERVRSANVFISFSVGTSKALNSIPPRSFSNRIQRLNGVTDLLRQNAKTSQAAVMSFLAGYNGLKGVKSFWITNQIYIKNAQRDLVATLETFPEISEIRLEGLTPLDKFEPSDSSPQFEGNVTWGLEKIQVVDVWNLEGGNQGEGVLVGSIDTGVLHTHEALRHNFAGEYGWFDPYNGMETPYDVSGHGTHTLGTIAGSNGIGVAPGVHWMSCRGCQRAFCSDNAILACGEFVQCPTLADGSNPDCSRAPHLLSNSWAGDGGVPFFYPVIESWVAAGLVPIFAIGNSGDSCGSAGAPGDHPLAIGVGNTNSTDGLRPTSGRGPAVSGIIKPDISAPGTEIYSAWATTEDSYFTLTGTSMAAPHVAGLAALLLSRNPNLTLGELKFYLTFGNEQVGLGKPGQDCDGVSENTFPNNAFGHGRINALNSFNKLIADESADSS